MTGPLPYSDRRTMGARSVRTTDLEEYTPNPTAQTDVETNYEEERLQSASNISPLVVGGALLLLILATSRR